MFRNWVLQNFPYLENEFDALTDYELFCKMMEYVKNFAKDNEDFKKQLESYENYFKNLDVQEEINNKLDEMTEDGTLQEIIESYINLNAIIGFNNIDEMKASTNLINGSYAKVLGYNTSNDNGKNTYLIRTKLNDDIIDNDNLILLNSGLVAELIKENDFIKLEKEGCYKFTGAQGNHATVWYAIISHENKPKLTIANNIINTVQHGYLNARDNLSTVTINAGIFNTETDETIGIVIKDGVTIKGNNNPEPSTEILYMLQDGTLKSIASSTDTSVIESLNPAWAVNGFYPIIKDGVDLTPARDPLDFVERSFIGQNLSGDYIVGCCNGRDYYNKGMSLADIVAFCGIVNFEPYFLFNLDGGGSSELDIRGERVNDLEYYSDTRKVANFITFKSQYARNKSIFDKTIIANQKWIKDQNDLNNGINILPLLSSANSNVSIVSGSSAFKRGTLTILNLVISVSDTLSTYTNLVQGIPRLSEGRDVQFCELISHTDGSRYQCYLYDTEHTIRLSGSSALPDGLPAGDYTLNITYNNYI